MVTKLGSKVKIKQNGLEGIVKVIWNEINATTKYLVRYTDSTGRLAEDWLVWQDVEVIETDA